MGSTDARVHDSRIYNRRVSCPRNSNPRPSLFTILAHLTCFLPVFPSGPVLYLISTSRPASIPATTASTTTTTNADEPKSSSEHLVSNSLKHGERGRSYILSNQISHTYKMFGRSRKASVSQTTTKSKPPSTAVTRDSGVSKRRPSTASRRRPSNACSAQSLVDPSGKWVTPQGPTAYICPRYADIVHS